MMDHYQAIDGLVNKLVDRTTGILLERGDIEDGEVHASMVTVGYLRDLPEVQVLIDYLKAEGKWGYDELGRALDGWEE